MKINYIRVSASALVILANVLGGNAKVTEVTTNTHNSVVEHRLNSLPQQNNYNSNNTIISITKRISLP
jgi:hypothetical protein